MKYMYNRCAHFFNTFLIVVSLAVSACGRSAPVPTPDNPGYDGNTSHPSYLYCGRLYNTQVNMFTKMEACEGVLKDRFQGFDIPGFPPNAGVCGETFGTQCYQEEEALATLENCVAMMPVCLPERVVEWAELWRHTCLELYNKYSRSTACDIKERGSSIRKFRFSQDSDDN